MEMFETQFLQNLSIAWEQISKQQQLRAHPLKLIAIIAINSKFLGIALK
jgi:hypothetical protein